MTEKKSIVARLELRPRKAQEAAKADTPKPDTPPTMFGEGGHSPKPIPATSDSADSEKTDTPISVDAPERQPAKAASDQEQAKVAGTPDLDKATDPEEIDFGKELSDYEKKSVSSALALLESKGFTRIEIASGQAKMWDPGQPDEGPDFDAAKSHVEKSYKGDQSKNDNTFFTTKAPDPETGMGGSAKEMTISAQIEKLAAEDKLIVMSSAELDKALAAAADRGARVATAAVLNKLAAQGFLSKTAMEGIQQTNQTSKQTDTQKEMEKSDPPRGDVQNDMPFDMADPSDIDALERVDQMPFDKVNPGAQAEGRQITRDPAKV